MKPRNIHTVVLIQTTLKSISGISTVGIFKKFKEKISLAEIIIRKHMKIFMSPSQHHHIKIVMNISIKQQNKQDNSKN